MQIDNQKLPTLKAVLDFASGPLLRVVRDITLPKPLQLGIVVKRDSVAALAFLRVGDPTGLCNVTGRPMPWWGRKWLVSPHMTDGEIVQTVFLATHVALEHELREQFAYQGQAVMDPHYDVHKLVALRARPDALQERSTEERV